MARAPSPTCPPIFPAPVLRTHGQIRSSRRIGALSVCPNLLEFGFRFLQKHHPWLAFLSAVIRKPDGGVYRFSLYGKDSFQILRLDQPLALALKHDELDRRGDLMKAAEEPDEKDDWDRYADQPKQKTSTHNFLLLVASQPNVGSELKFQRL